MRASDIISQLAVVLPKLVDDFTTNLDVTSLTRTGTTVTVTTGVDHGLSINKLVNIVGAKTPIVIEAIYRVGIVGTLTTVTDHDMTQGVLTEVEIEGATESELNGTFTIISIPNRTTIKYQIDDSGAIAATGTPLLINGSNVFKSYNGLQQVTAVPTTTTFTYDISDSTLFTPASGTIVAKKQPRISSSVTVERSIDGYTKQLPDNAWLFVVMGDGLAQKNRRIDVDSTDNLQRANFFNQRITQTFSLYLFLPASNEIAGRAARDRAEELLQPICQSILFKKVDSLLSGDDNPVQFNEHGFQDYNTAFYIHRYTFESTLQMSFEDTVGFDDDVAFRDIDLTIDFAADVDN